MSFHKILVAIDNSALCQSVFAQALELAQSYQAVIKLIHAFMGEIVVEPTPTIAFDSSLPLGSIANDYQTQQIFIQQKIDEVQALLQHYCQIAVSQGVATSSDYKIGEAGPQLCEEAKEWGADLIVVGRRGRKGLTEALLGSVSNYVLHHAPCSVLVIQEVSQKLDQAAITPTSS
jgi:nucleotide-binding universal stress UspA family protein